MKKVITNSAKAWILAARPKTLAGAAVPVMVGLALAYAHTGALLKIIPAALCLLFAFLMQINANFINDYLDFKKGTDRADRLGPERACAQKWITPTAMKRGIVATTICAVLAGLPLVFYGGMAMIIVGVVCIIFAFLYTAPLSYLGLGDIMVLVFFGFVPVGFTFYLQTGVWTATATIAGAACGLAIDTLLMINNYRDRQTDAKSGKRTIVVRLGQNAGSYGYLLAGVAAVAICWLMALYNLMWAAALPMLYLYPHYTAWQQMIKINQGKALNAILGKTSRNILIFGILIVIGLIVR